MPVFAGDRSAPRWARRIAAPSAILLAAGLALAACGGEQADAGPVSCSYASSGEPLRMAQKPASVDVPAVGEIGFQLRTSAGNIDITLDRAGAPCAVNSFESLYNQAYFVHTPCHRLTTAPIPISILQCGDPTGTGVGGPGYVVEDEPPTGLEKANPDAEANDEDAAADVVYPRGTIALANRGVPNSGGSQFFIVYADSVLPPEHSVIGTVDDASLPVLDAIAAAGTDSHIRPGDGRPTTPIMINAVDKRF